MAVKRILKRMSFEEVDDKVQMGLCLVCGEPYTVEHQSIHNYRLLLVDKELEDDGEVLPLSPSSATSSTLIAENSDMAFVSPVPKISDAEDTKQSPFGEDNVSDSMTIPHQAIKEETIADLAIEHVDEQRGNDVAAFRSRSCFSFILGDLRYEFMMFTSTTMVPTLSWNVFPPPKPPDGVTVPTSSLVLSLSIPSSFQFMLPVYYQPPEPPDLQVHSADMKIHLPRDLLHQTVIGLSAKEWPFTNLGERSPSQSKVCHATGAKVSICSLKDESIYEEAEYVDGNKLVDYGTTHNFLALFSTLHSSVRDFITISNGLVVSQYSNEHSFIMPLTDLQVFGQMPKCLKDVWNHIITVFNDFKSSIVIEGRSVPVANVPFKKALKWTIIYKCPVGMSRMQPMGITTFPAIMATLGFHELGKLLKMTSNQLILWYATIVSRLKFLLQLYSRSSRNKIVCAYAKDHYFDMITNKDDLVVSVLGEKVSRWVDPDDAILLQILALNCGAAILALVDEISLDVGTKLQVLVTEMAFEITERHEVVHGMSFVQASCIYFWFRQPQLMIPLTHFALFQNVFHLTYILWTWYCFGLEIFFGVDYKLTIIKVAFEDDIAFPVMASSASIQQQQEVLRWLLEVWCQQWAQLEWQDIYLPSPPSLVQLCFEATFFVGLFKPSMGILRLGFIIDSLSKATPDGFMASTSIIMALEELKGMLGRGGDKETCLSSIDATVDKESGGDLVQLELAFKVVFLNHEHRFLFVITFECQNCCVLAVYHRKIIDRGRVHIPLVGFRMGLATIKGTEQQNEITRPVMVAFPVDVAHYEDIGSTSPLGDLLKFGVAPILVLAHYFPTPILPNLQWEDSMAIFHRKMIYKGNVRATKVLVKWKTLPLKHDTWNYSSLRTRMLSRRGYCYGFSIGNVTSFSF